MKSRNLQRNSIRRSLPRLIQWLMLLMVLLILPVNILVQMRLQFQAQEKNSQQLFGQMEQLLKANQRDLERTQWEHSQECIRAADMAAYFVEHDPHMTRDLAHSQELAEKLGVDELHFFTPEGVIYGGTTPQYYGFTFESGEQMKFFLPMLEDKTLQLCQEITPNTAEGKLMQYAATWLSDGSGIVQIGLEPKHLQEVMEEKSLQAVISNLPIDLEGELHIVDRETMTVLATTQAALAGQSFSKEFTLSGGEETSIFHHTYEGKSYNVYTKKFENQILVRSYPLDSFVESVVISTLLVLCYVVFVSISMLLIVRWYVSRKILGNLSALLEEMRQIEKGGLTHIQLDAHVAEFDEIVRHVNRMISSIQSSWRWMSYIIDKSHIPAGILEKSSYHNRLFVNQQMYDILGIEKNDLLSQEVLSQMILDKLEQALKQPVDQKDHIYFHEKNGKTVYLQIEKDMDQQSVIYYVIDVSRWRMEINHLKGESEEDPLTLLLNRRGFHHKMEQVLSAPSQVAYGLMGVIDADGLKLINDTYGHGVGDAYLQAIAQAIQETAGEKMVCARVGGDEFVFFSYGHQSPEEAEKALENLKAQRGRPFPEALGHTLQFSIGPARFPADSQDYRELMRLADERMYQEKRARQSRG